jgi:hypothetical protein
LSSTANDSHIPVILVASTIPDKQRDPKVLHPFPICQFQAFEEVVQTQVVAKDKNALLRCVLDDWENFIMDQSADPKYSIIAGLICGEVVTAII